VADRVAGGATLGLLASLFLPWFAVSAGFGSFTAAGFGSFTASSSADALTVHGCLDLVLLPALAVIGYPITRGPGSRASRFAGIMANGWPWSANGRRAAYKIPPMPACDAISWAAAAGTKSL
jgi:hypothetical protein